MDDTAKLNVSAEHPTGPVIKSPTPPPIAPTKQEPDYAAIVVAICIAQVFILVVAAVFSYLNDFTSYRWWWWVFTGLEAIYGGAMVGLALWVSRKK